MFKEGSIILKVDLHVSPDGSGFGYSDIQCDKEPNPSGLRLFEERSPAEIEVYRKPRLIQTKSRAVINKVELNDKTFHLEMFCLYEARVVSNTVSYEAQM